MEPLNKQDGIAQLPEGGQLATWSRIGDPWRPDVVELQDGRILKIHIATTASAERLCFAVSVLQAPLSGMLGAAARVLGGAGLMFRHQPSGAWELYPRERSVDRLQRGSAEHHGIHCSEQASIRTAALQLVILSDQLTRSCFDYVGDDEGHKLGTWRVKLLPLHADGFCTKRPEPQSLRVPAEGRQFLLTNTKGDRCRLAIVPWRVNGCETLEAHPLAVKQANGDRYPVPVFPASVTRHCLSRCWGEPGQLRSAIGCRG